MHPTPAGKRGRVDEQLRAIAVDLLTSESLRRTDEPSPRWFFHDGNLWAFHKLSVLAALKRHLSRQIADGVLRLDKPRDADVNELLAWAGHLINCGDVESAALTETEVSDMFSRGRKMIVLNGGAIDLAGDVPKLCRPVPKDALVLKEEVVDAPCPETLEDLPDTANMKEIFDTLFGANWVIFIDLVVQTLLGYAHKVAAVAHSTARSTLKSNIMALLAHALSGTRCANDADKYMIGRAWCSSASSRKTPMKETCATEYGSAFVRSFDDVDIDQVYMAAILAEQNPTRVQSVAGFKRTGLAPMYVFTTNRDPEAIFATPPTTAEADKIYCFDLDGSLFARPVDSLSDEEKARREKVEERFLILNGLKPGTRALKQTTALEVASLVVSWRTGKMAAERAQAAELGPSLTLSRRRAAQQQLASAVQNTGDPLERLRTWLAENRGRFIQIAGAQLKRGDIYTAAGVGVFTSGGGKSTKAAGILNAWVCANFTGAMPDQTGGKAGYKGLRLLPAAAASRGVEAMEEDGMPDDVSFVGFPRTDP